MSKGSTRRPTNEEAFQANYEAIFGASKEKIRDAIDEAVMCEFHGCKQPETCSNPFCNCEVKHDPK